MPDRIAKLPRDEVGRPVPRFVATVDGKPDFRIMDPEHLRRAIRLGVCWTCGETLGGHKHFVIGPMCAVNRVSAEPPSHNDCATYSAQACPFLTNPNKTRREANMPQTAEPAGVMIARNPGVTLVWGTKKHTVFGDGGGGILFNIGEPTSVAWYTEGREATRSEVLASIDSGLPILREMAVEEGPRAVGKLDAMVERAMVYLP
jgi:hypothetical protein